VRATCGWSARVDDAVDSTCAPDWPTCVELEAAAAVELWTLEYPEAVDFESSMSSKSQRRSKPVIRSDARAAPSVSWTVRRAPSRVQCPRHKLPASRSSLRLIPLSGSGRGRAVRINSSIDLSPTTRCLGQSVSRRGSKCSTAAMSTLMKPAGRTGIDEPNRGYGGQRRQHPDDEDEKFN
jgi:hypothetical protein